MRKTLLLVFCILMSDLAVADKPELPYDATQLKEIALLPGPDELVKAYQVSSNSSNACIGGAFQDQGSWFFCVMYVEKEEQRVDLPSWVHLRPYYSERLVQAAYDWVALEGCDEKKKIYYIKLNNEIPLAGLKNCQLLTAKNISADQKTATTWRVLNKEGDEIWRYEERIELQGLIPNGSATSVLHDMTSFHRDLIVNYDGGYILWDGQGLKYLTQSGKLIWQVGKADLLLKEERSAEILVDRERVQPRIFTSGSGKIYFSFFVRFTDQDQNTDDEFQFVIVEIKPEKREFGRVFQDKNSISYEPMILGNGELAVLELNRDNALILLKYDTSINQWNKLWESIRPSYQEIFSSLNSPAGHFILLDDSIRTTNITYDYEGANSEEPFSIIIPEIDFAIRILKLDEKGYITDNKNFILEKEFITAESTIWPIGYLTYLPTGQVQIMLHVTPHYPWSRDWQKFNLMIKE